MSNVIHLATAQAPVIGSTAGHDELFDAILNAIYRYSGMSLASSLGILELVKDQLKEEH